MTEIRIDDRAGTGSPRTPTLLLSAALAAALGAGPVPAATQTGCARSTSLAFLACRHETMDDYFRSAAVCENLPDAAERRECERAARSTRGEDLDACAEQREARANLCALTGEDRYAPDFDPANFVDPNDIGGAVATNPFFPLVVGNEWAYDDGEQTTRVVVTDKIKRIEGVPCRVVNDIVSVDGDPIEDTNDWVAQDLEGNVWYCGEEVKDYETFEDDDPAEPELVSIDGSFKAGRDGALPGTWVLAAPQVGDVYRQEADIGNAEDAVEVTSITGTETVPATACAGNCLVTREFTPLEPGLDAYKYYAPDVGLILEIGHDGARNELVEFSPAD